MSTQLQNQNTQVILSSVKGDIMAKDRYAETKYKWKAENTKIYTTRVSKVSERDIMDWLETHRPTNAYIKGLIRKDMEQSKD